MKHFFSGVLFFYLFSANICLAAIDVTISDLVKKDDYFQVTTEVVGMSTSSGTFVQGMFTSIESPNYFGYTLSRKGEWILYDGSPEKSFVVENFVELKNNQPQVIFIKPNYLDKDYRGPGKYFLKLKRYTATGSSSDYSNTIELDLSNSASTPVETPTSSPTFTATSNPTPPPQTVVTPPAATTTRSTPTLQKPTSTPNILITSQVLATTSSEVVSVSPPENQVESDRITITPSLEKGGVSDKNLFLIGVGILSLSGVLLYFRLKNL